MVNCYFPLLFLVCKDKHQDLHILLMSYTVEDCAPLAIVIFQLVSLFVDVKPVCDKLFNDRLLKTGTVLALTWLNRTHSNVVFCLRQRAGFAVPSCSKRSLPFQLLEEIAIFKDREQYIKNVTYIIIYTISGESPLSIFQGETF